VISTMKKMPAVFIDRDGTINEEVGYLNNPDELVLFPFAAEAIKLLNDNGYLAVVVTNQAGVGRGYFTEDKVHLVNERMYEQLAKHKAQIDALYYCPHHTSSKEPRYAIDCDCRKPKTGMIDQALKDLPIDKNKMYMIGDKKSDIKLGINTGCKTYFVKTGYGTEQSAENPEIADVITDNLLTAVEDILKGGKE
jgi:D-glycero-D-manno-heptose 1,7-bisphosphate phosphatase